MFVNLDPRTLEDPRLIPFLCGEALPAAGLPERRIVLEITEVTLQRDRAQFARTLEVLRARGFRIAVDDLGSGYSSLAIVGGLCPDFIKTDRSLLRGASGGGGGRALLETLIGFGRRIGATVVVEGVESPGDLSLAVASGADCVQGFYLGRPAGHPAGPVAETWATLRAAVASGLRPPQEVTLGEIAAAVPTLDAGTETAQVMRLFEERPDVQAVALLGGTPPGFVGLLSRRQLYRRLAWQYGYALHARRAIGEMGEVPLLLDADTPVAAAAQALSARGERRGADGAGYMEEFIGVTDGGGFAGVVSGQRLLERVATIRLDLAQAANPLTGLPGNRRIEAELGRRIEFGSPFCVIYADIDDFKRINDTLGFVQGDALIRALGSLLEECVVDPEAGSAFAGHIGGDDFLLATTGTDPLALGRRLAERFERVARDWLETALTEAGPGEGPEAEGATLPRLSLAILVCRGGRSGADAGTVVEVAALARAAAVLKARAKAGDGLAVGTHTFRMPAAVTTSQ